MEFLKFAFKKSNSYSFVICVQGVEAIIKQAINHRVRRQQPHKKRDFDALIRRLEHETSQLGIGCKCYLQFKGLISISTMK